jgi:membrane protein
MKTMKQLPIVRRVVSIVQDTSKTFAPTPRKFALKDWKSALIATKNAIASKNIAILAAGIAYFLTFALFPTIAATVAISSFFLAPEDISRIAQVLDSFLPSDIALLISSQLTIALSNPSSSVAVAIIGISIALFSISGAMGNVIKAVNALYEVDENRTFIKQRLVSVAHILLAACIIGVVILLLVLNENVLSGWGVPLRITWAILIIRWIVIAGIVTLGLSIFYRYAPNRRNPHWQWVTWGSLIATLVWLIGTTLFFLYARYFAHYSESYSVFAGIIVLMIWLNLTAFATLLGATINRALEDQTRVRTSS